MRTITFLSQKGGSGKTTLAVHIAVAAQATDETVTLIDTDPQGSATAWGQARKSKPPVVHRAIPSMLGEALQKAKQEEATLAIVDTPPHTTPCTWPHESGHIWEAVSPHPPRHEAGLKSAFDHPQYA